METLSKTLHELAPRHYGRQTAHASVRLANESISNGVAIAARSSSLRMLRDQLEHTQANLDQVQREIDPLLNRDPKAKGSTPRAGIWADDGRGTAGRIGGS